MKGARCTRARLRLHKLPGSTILRGWIFDRRHLPRAVCGRSNRATNRHRPRPLLQRRRTRSHSPADGRTNMDPASLRSQDAEAAPAVQGMRSKVHHEKGSGTQRGKARPAGQCLACLPPIPPPLACHRKKSAPASLRVQEPSPWHNLTSQTGSVPRRADRVGLWKV